MTRSVQVSPKLGRYVDVAPVTGAGSGEGALATGCRIRALRLECLPLARHIALGDSGIGIEPCDGEGLILDEADNYGGRDLRRRRHRRCP